MLETSNDDTPDRALQKDLRLYECMLKSLGIADSRPPPASHMQRNSGHAGRGQGGRKHDQYSWSDAWRIILRQGNRTSHSAARR
jgi:hypothetical protein